MIKSIFLLLCADARILFFSPFFQGDYDKAGLYYMASVKEINKPREFVLPYYG